MRTLTLTLAVLAGLALGKPAAAAPPPPDALIRQAQIGGGVACLAFVDAQAVEHRKDRWRSVIDAIWRVHPQFVLDWLIGASAPPHAVVTEALKQRDCLLQRLVIDAADARSHLIVDHQKEPGTKPAMDHLHAQYSRSGPFRDRLHRTLTESDHRDARTQSWIWKRKFVFSGRNFNFVSPAAAQRCGLVAHESWKPDNARHRTCWQQTLSPAEREREILQASAAPGISRHHWGTDFDLFGLNPILFRTGRFADEYLWMTHNAVQLGFFQPYTSREMRGERYMEERWHWSYYPIAQALLEFAAEHVDEVGEALDRQWRAFEASWTAAQREPTPYFSFIRAHWREFMFNIDASAVRGAR